MADPAVGEANIEQVRNSGDHWVIRGLVTADSTARSIALTNTSGYLLWFNADNSTDDDTYLRVVLNSDDGTEDTAHGAVYLQTSSGDDDVFRFEAGAIF